MALSKVSILGRQEVETDQVCLGRIPLTHATIIISKLIKLVAVKRIYVKG